MISRTRLRQLLMLALLAGGYTIEPPAATAQASEFCDQICWSGAYCGLGCYDEANQAYTDCWEYSGGNCDETYPCFPYVSSNWVEISRTQIARKTEFDHWPYIFGTEICVYYYSVQEESLCGLGEHTFCERQLVDVQNCPYGSTDWGQTCDQANLDCFPGNDCK